MEDVEVIKEWINLFNSQFQSIKGISKKLDAYADIVVSNEVLENALFTVLDDYRINEKQLLEPVYNCLFSYFRCKNERLNKFSINFLPCLIGLYLQSTIKPLETRKKYKCIETALLGIYNLEVIDDDGVPKKITFRMPLMSKPSVYHDPSTSTLTSSIQPQSVLTEKALLKLESGSTDCVINTFGPYETYDRITAGNRMRVLTALLKIYHQNLSYVSKQSYSAFCRTILKLLRSGGHSGSGKKTFATGIIDRTTSTAAFSNYNDLLLQSPPKINLSSDFLVETLNCLYFCMYNGFVDIGLKVLEEVHHRAVNNLYANVLLMSNAIKNSFKLETTKQKSESHININSPISSVVSASNISKTAITNASFKTRKLPDDIPIIKPPLETLSPIDETNVNGDQRPNGTKS